jgi:hypothetical protein
MATSPQARSSSRRSTAASISPSPASTPWGNYDIPTDFDATAFLDPGDAAAGVSDAAARGFDLFDPSTWF